ncbi:DNA polymerase IV [Alteracholeplasma palmae J233]|uniref:DNA polymerase IV n=1 Tax=Alteracholeplasma palmae (strain ATCC 49389 / J233) TaxID=1318466 RepID=U4KLE6_ALTPJ|nr:DNA polymerase IV [Alteracholeplasma palmae]CCV64647.1 DNA polymerase IV [Alteracholeplasma palmae J233]
MKREVKIIFHIDLNAFYATCAMIKEPYLKNKVFAIGGITSSRRGVLSTASYKARALGIRAGMSLKEALDIFPKLLVVPTDFPFYREKSREFINFLKKYSELILQASIDEAYLDVTELAKTKHPLEIAKEIQTRLVNEYQLPCSIGIAPTLYLAKMGSDMKKPLGITILRKRELKDTIWPLDINDSFGIGKKTAKLLKEKNIFTINDFLLKENKDKILTVMSEKNYLANVNEMIGESNNIVDPNKYALPQSISHETTLNYAIDQEEALLPFLMELSERVYLRLKKYKMVYKTVGIKLKSDQFKTINRSYTFFDYQDEAIVIKNQVEALLQEYYDGTPLRLVGVFIQNLLTEEQLKTEYDLFNYQKLTGKEEKINEVIKKINQKTANSIKKGIK